MLCSDTVLIGHSVENDLKALRVIHNRILDTAVLYPHKAGPPFKNSLKYLTTKFLKRDIQKGDGGENAFGFSCSVY